MTQESPSGKKLKGRKISPDGKRTQKTVSSKTLDGALEAIKVLKKISKKYPHSDGAVNYYLTELGHWIRYLRDGGKPRLLDEPDDQFSLFEEDKP